MTASTRAHVVVGVDGSPSALSAVRWATAEAARRRVAVHLVHIGNLMPEGYPESVMSYPDYFDVLLDQGRQWLAEAADAARAQDPDVELTTDLRDGVVAKMLIQESHEAGLMVLGSRGLGGFAELLAGSVAVNVTAHAHCPVVVVRSSTVDGPAPEAGPVVVGVDGSPQSDTALAFAFEAAAARSAPLVAVHAWLDTALTGAWIAVPYITDWEQIRLDHERLLTERVAGWQDKYPDVVVHRFVDRDRPTHAISEHARHAQLVVVGSRGRGAVTGLGLGSVSQWLLHHATCPVAVVGKEVQS